MCILVGFLGSGKLFFLVYVVVLVGKFMVIFLFNVDVDVMDFIGGFE